MQHDGKRYNGMHHRRTAVVAGVAVALAGVTAAQAKAPASLTITFTKSGGKVAGTPHAGATTVHFKRRGTQAEIEIARLGKGVTPAAFMKQIHALGPNDTPDGVLAATHSKLVSGLSAPGSSTFKLVPGRYVAANVAASKPARYTSTSFTVPKGKGAALPRVKPTVTLLNYKIKPSGTLPAKGTWKIVNGGMDPHFLIAVKIPSGLSDAAAEKAIRTNDEKAFGKRPAELELLSVVSPGAVNEVPVNMANGRWVLACFYANADSKGRPHNMLGMEKAVRLR
jgi:hypothetical protein